MAKVTDPADPDRCKGTFSDGQCMNRASFGSDYCQAHGGQIARAEAAESRIYNLNKAQYRRRLAELKDHEEIKSLREEIALCRLLIEERFNKIQNDADLLAAYSTVNSLMLTLERLIKTTHQIEQNLGTLLSKPTVILLGQNLVQIINEELAGVEGYERIVDRTCERLFETIESTTNKDD